MQMAMHTLLKLSSSDIIFWNNVQSFEFQIENSLDINLELIILGLVQFSENFLL